MLSRRNLLWSAVAVVALLAVGAVAPRWLLFLVAMAASHGLAILGVVVLNRGGGATFGQGLFFAVGGYAAAITPERLGITDGVLRVVLGMVAAGVVGSVFAPLLARYRGIFFAMLTLALSMVGFGVLSKWQAIGGSDGFNLARPTLFGLVLNNDNADFAVYGLSVLCCTVASLAVRIYFGSSAGLLSQAVRGNALRVEYLGASARRSLARDFTIASALGGAGGALTALALGHVDPQLAYWTTSGEFVFAAILSGFQSVVAVFVASFVLEMVRSFSNLYFPNSWQLALGVFLLAVVLLRPSGIGSFWAGRKRSVESALDAPAPLPAPAVSDVMPSARPIAGQPQEEVVR
ncbi:MAG: inner-rane translocator [Rhizobacter sp.]|nr:inner-rane translocator [Rhizobacter sp.]